MHQPANTLVQLIKIKSQCGDVANAEAMASAAYGENSTVVRLLRKQFLASDSLHLDGDWRAAERAFIELVRSRSLIGKIGAVSGFLKLPALTPTLRQTLPLVASWVGQGNPIATTAASFERIVNDPLKLGAILPVTQEVLRGVGADFESALSADLVRAVAALEGVTFIDPANAGALDVSPASVLYGIPPIVATLNPVADLTALIASFAGDLETAVFVMHPATAVALSAADFDGIGARGGELLGVPAVTSSAVPYSEATGGLIALIDPRKILLSDSGIQFDKSDQALVQIGEDSSGEPQYLSLWQNNCSAVKIIRGLSWQVAQPGCATYLSEVKW
jgi:Phage capsid family.